MVAENLIERGLAARQNRAGMFDRARGIVTTPASIQTIRETFDVAAERHASAMRSITKAIAEWDDAAAKRIKAYRLQADGRTVRPESERRRFAGEVKANRASFIRQLFHSSKAELDAARREMLTVELAVKRSRELFSPLRIASSFELGGERRSRLLAELHGMPPAALKGVAIRAAADGDRELAGVLITINDKLDLKLRSFSSAELAESSLRRNVRPCAGAYLARHADGGSRDQFGACRRIRSHRIQSLASNKP